MAGPAKLLSSERTSKATSLKNYFAFSFPLGHTYVPLLDVSGIIIFLSKY